MANNKTTTAVQQDVTELVVEARFVMRSYDQTDKSGNTVKKEYVGFEHSITKVNCDKNEAEKEIQIV